MPLRATAGLLALAASLDALGVQPCCRLDRSGARSGQIEQQLGLLLADRGDLLGPWAGCFRSYTLLKQARCAGVSL